MPDPIAGIHHVTAVSGEAGGTVAFYRDVLGLRLVKVTVNFDDTDTYHLYFGNEAGDPGTSLTFFPFGGGSGRPGVGAPTATALAVPPGSLAAFWTDHLADHGITVDGPLDRFDERVCRFRDPDGQPLELVETDSPLEPWADGPIPADHAVRGFHGVTLSPSDPTATGSVLETMGFERTREATGTGDGTGDPVGAGTGDGTGDPAGRLRYEAPGEAARVVDLRTGVEERGRPGAGTVHHVAFRVPDEAAQDAWREELTEAGLRVTPPRDRHYFRSIYFREPGGVLFEIATEDPGFTEDEPLAELGTALQLPPWLEDDRESIERGLPPIDLSDPAGVGAGDVSDSASGADSGEAAGDGAGEEAGDGAGEAAGDGAGEAAGDGAGEAAGDGADGGAGGGPG